MDKFRNYSGEVSVEAYLKDELRMNFKKVESALKKITSSSSSTTTSSGYTSGQIIFVGESSVSGTGYITSYNIYENYFGGEYTSGQLRVIENCDLLVEVTIAGNSISAINEFKIYGYIGKNGSDFKQMKFNDSESVITGDKPTGSWSGVVTFAKNDKISFRFYSAGSFVGLNHMCVKITRL